MVKRVKAIVANEFKKLSENEGKIHNHDEFITTPDFNKLTTENFHENVKQENLASKSGLTDFIKNTYFDKNLRNVKNKVTSNKICKG